MGIQGLLVFFALSCVSVEARAESIGHPNRDGGRLENATELPRKGVGYFQQGYEPGRNFGTAELVSLIKSAGRKWHKLYPSRDFQVGDLSARKGGRIKPHGSHRSGLDADIEFFFDEKNAFEETENIALLKTFLAPVPLNLIYVGCPVKKRLCERFEREGRLGDETRFLSMLEMHAGHNEHFHVRIECPEGNDRCELPRTTRHRDEPGCPKACN